MREFRLIPDCLKVDKVTILINPYILTEVERFCMSAAIINKGFIVEMDTIENSVLHGFVD
jgi:ABC-type multidrug transport system ATPase subunit